MGLSTASAVDQRIITKIMFNYEKKSQYRFRSRPEDQKIVPMFETQIKLE